MPTNSSGKRQIKEREYRTARTCYIKILGVRIFVDCNDYPHVTVLWSMAVIVCPFMFRNQSKLYSSNIIVDYPVPSQRGEECHGGNR